MNTFFKMHRSGFVNIIGNPNVGKSTLMNELVGERLSVVTHKAQTTRHRILGIVNGEGYQIVFSDTPGIVKPAYRLHRSMMRAVRTAFTDADEILYVTDVTEKSDKYLPHVDRLKKAEIPVIVAINKTDLGSPGEVWDLKQGWKRMVPKSKVIPVSALRKKNLDVLLDKILELLPEGPRYYPDDDLTDRPERFFVAEIIREKVFLNYQQEIPYSCEVVIESFKEDEDMVRINAVIHVMRESQKGIIIGHKGEALKKVGIQARTDMEKFLGKKAYLGLKVKVASDWRNSERFLKSFGY
jgi:GTP-binding protein Era